MAEVISTINKSGEDYNTLTLWEDDKDGNLVTAELQQTASCYNDDGNLDDDLTIDDSTTDSTYYMKVTSPVGERHNGTAGAGFHLRPTNQNANAIYINDQYVRIEWLEISNWTGYSGWNYKYAIYIMVGGFAMIQYNIIHDSGNDTRNHQSGINAGRTNYIHDNFIYNVSGTGIREYAGYATIYIYNNTVYNYNTKSGGTQKGVTMHGECIGEIKNNLVIAGGNGGDCFAFGKTTHDYNASSDATANGANSLNSGDGTPPSTNDFESVAGGAEDLHLVSTAVEIDEGKDLGDVAAAIDIDNRNRHDEGDTWDIGADEWVSIGVKVVPKRDFISGYHCFISQYLRAKVEGLIPLKLPDGTVF